MFVNELYSGGIRALFEYDNTIFNGLTVPDGIDAAEVIDRIILKYGDTPIFCANPDVIKYYIGRWSERRGEVWARYKEVIDAKYNPIENYDRYETGENVVEEQISADNASTYQPDRKTLASPNMHIHGNIGVTTAAQMQKEILDLIPQFDVVDFIADDFKSEFCLYVY